MNIYLSALMTSIMMHVGVMADRGRQGETGYAYITGGRVVDRRAKAVMLHVALVFLLWLYCWFKITIWPKGEKQVQLELHSRCQQKEKRSERIVKGTLTELNFICFFVYSVHIACSLTVDHRYILIQFNIFWCGIYFCMFFFFVLFWSLHFFSAVYLLL